MRSPREKLYRAAVHPTLGISLILFALLLSGAWSYGFDWRWLLVSSLGVLSFQLGFTISSKLEVDRLHRISFLLGEVLTFILVAVSFREVAPLLFPIISLAWVSVLNMSAYAVAVFGKRGPLFQLITYSSGMGFVIHSFLQYGGWDEIRKLPLIPVEGAFGMFLLFISYPSVLWWLLEERGNIQALLFFSLTSGLMILHGFRADVFLVVLTTFLLLVKRKSPSGFALLTILLVLFILVGEVRSYVNVPSYERLVFRLATTYYYSKELCRYFLTPFPPFGPFWVSSIPLHPSQSFGRGIFGKEYGITPTMFVGLLVDLGLLGMMAMSLILGLLSGYGYRLSMDEGNDHFSYSIIWPILITRTEVGFSQLDLALVAGSALFASLANLINGRETKLDR